FAKVSSICSIVWKGYRPLAPLGRIRTSVSVRYGFEKYAYRLRASLAVAPAAMSAVPAESAARWSSQAISGSRISTLMIPGRARSASHVKACRGWTRARGIGVVIGIPWIPAAAKVCGFGCRGGQIGIGWGRVLCGRAAGQQQPCEGDRYQPPTHSVKSPLAALRLVRNRRRIITALFCRGARIAPARDVIILARASHVSLYRRTGGKPPVGKRVRQSFE